MSKDRLHGPRADVTDIALARTRAQTARKTYERPSLRPLDRGRWRQLVAVTALVDTFALGTALSVATATRFGGDALKAQGPYGRKLWVWLILWWCSLAVAGLYERQRTDDRVEELRNVVNGISLGAAVAIAGAFFAGFELSRAWAALVWALGLVFVLFGRTCLRAVVQWMRRRGRLRRRAIIVGADESAHTLAAAVARAPWEGVDVVGFVSTDFNPADGPTLGSIDDLRDIVIGAKATEVLVSSGAAARGRFSEIVAALDGLPVELRIAPGLDGFLASRLAVHPLGDQALVAVERVELRASAKAFKRSVDLLVGIPATLIALPLIACCAAAIRLDSNGPVFFRQPRVGVDGRRFKIWKLRTMIAGAEAALRDLDARNDAPGLLFKLRADPRVTRVGRFLRKTSLDELPQLFNVLSGAMSLVGPRPPLVTEVERYDDPLRRRLLVKPGITGLWQVSGRAEASFDEYVRYDLLYVQNWSVALDLFILLRTIPAVLTSKGAY